MIFNFFMILIIVLCFLLVVIILSQNPKGGGLSGTFGGGGSQMFGVQRTNDFMDKATWTLGIAIVCLVLISSTMYPRQNVISTDIEDVSSPESTESTTDLPAKGEDTGAKLPE